MPPTDKPRRGIDFRGCRQELAETGDGRNLQGASVFRRARKKTSLRIAKRLIGVDKNPSFIRDRNDSQCHVRVFVFSCGGREAAVRGRGSKEQNLPRAGGPVTRVRACFHDGI